jgi:HlyD family secretion protein
MRTTLLISILALLILAGCNGNQKAAGGSGFVEANEVLISAETSGRILVRNFDDGTAVKAGETLAVIDPSRLELDIASMTATRQSNVATLETSRLAVTKAKESEDYAKSERDRIARLLKAGSATQKQLDDLEYQTTQATVARKSAEAGVTVVQAQIEKIDADLNRLIRQLKDCYPIAPTSGTVTEKFVEVGEVVAPGKSLVKIANLDTVSAKVYLPAGLFSSIKVGEKATVSTESGGTTYTGDVTWTSPEAEFTPKNVQTEKSRANLVYAVKVRIPNPDNRLKIGMPVFISLER